MGISTSYPLLDVFLTILMVFAWFAYIWVAVTVLIDIFRRDMSGIGKVLWVLIVVVFSWLGVLLYLLLYHRGMNERRLGEARAAQAQFDQYVQHAAGAQGPASEINRAKGLLDSGTITKDEFEQIKAKALAS